MDYYKHQSAEISPEAVVGEGSKIWHHAHIREGAVIGKGCVISQNVYIDTNVSIGDFCRIQNNCSIYRTSRIGNFVFLGPNVILTNDRYPRAFNREGKPVSDRDWESGTIVIGDGASVGAGSIILPDITIGEYVLIGAGSVVTKNIDAFALAFGNPAVVRGKVDKSGRRIP